MRPTANETGATPHETDPLRGSLGPLLIAWKRKHLVLFGVVMTLALGAFYYAQQRPVYRATAQVMVIKKYPDTLPVPGMETQRMAYEDYVSAHLVLIQSPLIVGRAVKANNLGGLKSFGGQTDPTGQIIGSLSLTREGEGTTSGILNLAYRGPVAEDCGTILNAVIASYQEFLQETYSNVSKEAADLITSSKNILRGDLAKKKDTYKEFRLNNPLVLRSKEGGGAVQQDRLVNIEQKLSTLVLHRAELQGRLAAVRAALKEGRDPTPLMEKPNSTEKGSMTDPRSGEIAALERELRELALKEEELLVYLGQDNSDVKVVRRRMNAVRENLELLRTGRGKTGKTAPEGKGSPEKAAQAYIKWLEEELEESRILEATLNDLFKKERDEYQKVASFEIQDEEFRKDIATTQQLYDSIIKRLQEIDLVKDHGGYDAKTIAPPQSGSKVEPNAMPIFGMCLFLGLVLGWGLAWLAEVSDKSFRNVGEIRHWLRLPVIGHMHHQEPEKLSPEQAGVQKSVPDETLVTLRHPKSVVSEAYRGLRTALYFSGEDQKHRVIQVTSPEQGDGKSTLVSNLAVSIAQSGKTVLLIDADFRRPRIHKLFGLSDEVGMALVMAGEAELDDAIQATVVDGLAVLPCGPRPPNPAELLTSHRFNKIVEVVRERYDFVLMDTPPVLAVSDPSVVAPRVDGVILLIRLSKHDRPRAVRSREILTSLGANILGVVVNNLGGKRGPGYEDFGYEYGYGYKAGYSNGYYQESEPEPPVNPGKAPGNGERGPGSDAELGLGATLPPATPLPPTHRRRVGEV
jgi:capsular exopolysaccharide synthesis family protein